MNIEEIQKVKIFREYSNYAHEISAINLAQGIPEPIIEDKVNHYLKENLHHGWAYTDTHGTKALRLAVCAHYHNDFAIENTLITSGGAESIYLSFALAKEQFGNKITYIAPFFPFYKSTAELFGMQSIIIDTTKDGNTLILDFDALEKSFINGSKTFILNTPHNPCGWVINLSEARQLRTLLDKYGVLLILDEVYRHYIYNDTIDEINAIKTLYQNNDKILIIGSASKFLSVTGMRIGWLIGNPLLLELPFAFHSHTSHCQPAPLQHTVADLMNNSSEWFSQVKNHYQIKRDKLVPALRDFGFKCYDVDGGHFVLAEYDRISPEPDSNIFAREFGKKYGVLPLTTNVFYAGNHFEKSVRFSLTPTMNSIDKTLIKLKA